VVKLAPEDSALLTAVVPEERARLRPLAEAFAEEDLLRTIDVLTKAETDLRWAQDPRVTLELALLKLVQMRRLLPFQELVDKVERLAGGLPALPPAPPPPSSPRAAAPLPVSVPAPREAAAPLPAREVPRIAPAPRPDGAGSADGVLAAMVQAAQSRPSLLQPLRVATARLDGDTLVLEVAADWTAFAEMHQDEYRELASKAAGRTVKLRLGAGANSAPLDEAAPAPADVRRERLMKEAEKEPAVQEALDLFDGRLVDVREAKPGQ
jgi:DNA polymerase III gamma/tau subunit